MIRVFFLPYETTSLIFLFFKSYYIFDFLVFYIDIQSSKPW